MEALYLLLLAPGAREKLAAAMVAGRFAGTGDASMFVKGP